MAGVSYAKYTENLGVIYVTTGCDGTNTITGSLGAWQDNVALIKKNLEQNLRLDHLEYDWYNEQHISQSMMNRYNLNYIPAFMELTKMYYSSGEFESAKFWENKAVFLAKKANDEDLIKKIEEKNW